MKNDLRMEAYFAMNGMDCIYCDGELSRVVIVNTFLSNTIEKYSPGLFVFECIECKRKILFADGERTRIRGTVKEWAIDAFKYGQEIFIESGEMIIWDECEI